MPFIFHPRLILIALLLLVWLWKRSQDQKSDTPTREKPLKIEIPPEKTSQIADSEPVEATAPEPPVEAPDQTADVVEPDDLRRIEGIGPKISSVLHDAGVFTYSQLSSMDVEQIRELLNAGGIRVARPDTWPEQAHLAASGDWEALETLQAELKGGRRV